MTSNIASPRSLTLLIALTVGTAVVPGVQAAGDPARGKEKSAQCVACHGEDGNSAQPTFPRLAGQHQSYLVHSLKGYRSGSRKNAIMQGFAGPLSDQDIADLAAWYASQEGLTTLEGQR